MGKKLAVVSVPRIDVAAVVDELGAVKARIAMLTAHETNLKERLAGEGVGDYEGRRYRATVSVATRTGQDAVLKAKATELLEANTTPQFRAAHTTTTVVTAVKVVARVRDANKKPPKRRAGSSGCKPKG